MKKRRLLLIVFAVLLCVGCAKGIPELTDELALDVFMDFVAMFAPPEDLEAVSDVEIKVQSITPCESLSEESQSVGVEEAAIVVFVNPENAETLQFVYTYVEDGWKLGIAYMGCP